MTIKREKHRQLVYQRKMYNKQIVSAKDSTKYKIQKYL